MKTGIFGGTFDPVHNGHVRAASEFLRQASLDRLYIIPDRIPPHKSIGAGDDPAMRLMMTRLAFSASPEFSGRAVVSDMEVKSEGKSYTYLTLKRFVDMGFSGLYLYCGTDMLLTFDEWYRFEDILPCARSPMRQGSVRRVNWPCGSRKRKRFLKTGTARKFWTYRLIRLRYRRARSGK